ncbi:MAG: hypothetical protein MHPSP_004630 [Paramarteilia canceri]
MQEDIFHEAPPPVLTGRGPIDNFGLHEDNKVEHCMDLKIYNSLIGIGVEEDKDARDKKEVTDEVVEIDFDREEE